MVGNGISAVDDRSRTEPIPQRSVGRSVSIGKNGEHVVDFENEDCKCSMWQEYLSPCAHAISNHG